MFPNQDFTLLSAWKELFLSHTILHIITCFCVFCTVSVYKYTSLSSYILAVTLSLEPPPNDTGGVLFFEYCPTGLVSVNVTCSVEGLDTGLGIKPQVIIGPDHFYLRNQMKVEKWRIMVFTNSHTLLYFTLPLNDTTAGLAIRCQSDRFSSQSITLQSGKNVYNGLLKQPLKKVC